MAGQEPSWASEYVTYHMTDCEIIAIEKGKGRGYHFKIPKCTIEEGRQLYYGPFGGSPEEPQQAVFRYGMCVSPSDLIEPDEVVSHEAGAVVSGNRGKDRFEIAGKCWIATDDDGSFIELQFDKPPRISVPSRASVSEANDVARGILQSSPGRKSVPAQ